MQNSGKAKTTLLNVWQGGDPETSNRKGCRACQEKGEENRCEHCFRCVVVGHAARGCRPPKNPAKGRSDVKISVHSMRPDSSASILGYSGPQEKTQELLRQRIIQLEAELEQRGKTEHARAATHANHIPLRHQARLENLIGVWLKMYG